MWLHSIIKGKEILTCNKWMNPEDTMKKPATEEYCLIFLYRSRVVKLVHKENGGWLLGTWGFRKVS